MGLGSIGSGQRVSYYLFIFGSAVSCGCVSAQAQVSEPYDLVPLPAGTNLAEAYFSYSRYDGLNFTNGTSYADSGYDSYVPEARYEHFFSLWDHPASVQLIQTATVFENLHVLGRDESNAPGMGKLQANNTEISARFWPYANDARQTFIQTQLTLVPPDGSYDKYSGFTSNPSWAGAARAGLYQGFGPNFSIEGAFSGSFTGDVTHPGGVRTSFDPTVSMELWANWDWRNGLRTSIGYIGQFGGGVYIDDASAHRSAELQRVRASAEYWWSPRFMTGLTLARDIAAEGGYQLGITTTLRAKVLF